MLNYCLIPHLFIYYNANNLSTFITIHNITIVYKTDPFKKIPFSKKIKVYLKGIFLNIHNFNPVNKHLKSDTMKIKSLCLTGIFIILLSACEDTNNSFEKTDLSFPDYVAKRNFKSADSVSYEFPNIPQELVNKAIQAYNGEDLPAVTIAITYSYGNSNIDLETGWKLYHYSTPEPDCLLGEDLGYQGGNVLITNEDGFIFIEEEDLCGVGKYILDNRQGYEGGWFDYVCGPSSINFDYNGEPVFVLLRLWCE
jgi:hypothetical protein